VNGGEKSLFSEATYRLKLEDEGSKVGGHAPEYALWKALSNLLQGL